MGKRVLLIDDSLMVHMLLRKALEKNGFEICGDAKDGSEGVKLFESLAPDLVFMDITMPGMNGIEATKKIKQKDANVKIIMLTAMGDEGIRTQAKDAGVDVFLTKPFDDHKILSAVAKII